MTLSNYITRRILDSILLLLFTIAFNFALFRIMPGNPAIVFVGKQGQAKPEFIRAAIARFGLDRPLPEQFLIYLERLLQLDLGESISAYPGHSVISLIFSYRLFNTVVLMGASILISFTIALVLGTIAASKFKSRTDLYSIFVTLTAYSTPVFWIGLLIVFFLYGQFHLIPLGGAPKIEDPQYAGDLLKWALDYLFHLIGPLITLVISFVGAWFLIAREQMLGIFTEDYMSTARAKGLKKSRILFVHARKNAMLPMISLLAVAMTYLVTGATLTETVFSWDGLGLLTYSAIYSYDYALLQGVFLLVATVAIVANLIADILYAFLDPRIRY